MNFGRQDTGNADYFCALFPQQWLYHRGLDAWLRWQGHRWEQTVGTSEIMAAIMSALTHRRDTAAQRYEDSKELNKEWEFADKSLNAPRVSAVERLLRAKISTNVVLDSHPHLLGFQNGVYDFKARQFRPGHADDFMTKSCAIEYDASATEAPEWDRFLGSVFPDAPDQQEYLLRVSGYALTGYVDLQLFWMSIGEGQNGKGTWVRLLKHIMGDYFHTASMDSFMSASRARSGSEHSDDKASFAGKRLVVAEETTQGRAFSEGVMKSLTDSGDFNYRPAYGRTVTSQITFKTILTLNHRPIVTDDTHGFWRRLRMLLFKQDFTKRPTIGLDGLLAREAPAIVNRFIAAWHRVEDAGRQLPTPQAWEEAAREYREESDPLQDFLNEVCLVGPEYKVQHKNFYNVYRQWMAQNGHQRSLMSDRTFSMKMGQKGFDKRKGHPNNVFWWTGVGRKADYKTRTAPEPDA